MELWIRSQDREFFMKVNNINLGTNGIGEDERLFTFINSGTSLTSFTLGDYKTKERALEILDEIQDNLIRIETNNNMGCYDTPINQIVYEMPKE